VNGRWALKKSDELAKAKLSLIGKARSKNNAGSLVTTEKFNMRLAVKYLM
jgi:hypothetical protein